MSIYGVPWLIVLIYAAGTIIKFTNITYFMDQSVFRWIFVKTTNFIIYIMLHFTWPSSIL